MHGNPGGAYPPQMHPPVPGPPQQQQQQPNNQGYNSGFSQQQQPGFPGQNQQQHQQQQQQQQQYAGYHQQPQQPVAPQQGQRPMQSVPPAPQQLKQQQQQQQPPMQNGHLNQQMASIQLNGPPAQTPGPPGGFPPQQQQQQHHAMNGSGPPQMQQANVVRPMQQQQQHPPAPHPQPPTPQQAFVAPTSSAATSHAPAAIVPPHSGSAPMQPQQTQVSSANQPQQQQQHMYQQQMGARPPMPGGGTPTHQPQPPQAANAARFPGPPGPPGFNPPASSSSGPPNMQQNSAQMSGGMPGVRPPMPAASGGLPSQPGMPHAPMNSAPPRPGMPPMPGPPGGMPPGPPGGMQPGPGGMPGGPPGMPPMPGGAPPGPAGMHAHPPGMAGPPQQAQQQRAKLDPNLMPSAVQVYEDDRQTKSGLFRTGFPTAEQPPLATTDFYSEDQGNCVPQLMRATMYCTPASNDLLKQSELPFGLIISPMARTKPTENPPPIVDLGAQGPVRCKRCKAYMSPFMQFTDGGRRFQCPFCTANTEVEDWYFAHLDHQGRRTDLYSRPEMYLGAYEFLATTAYCKNSVVPKEPAFIFMLDVSYNSVRSGLVQLFCDNIKQLLQNLPVDTGLGHDRSTMRVGFVTYDQTLHFYNLKNALDQPQMMVVNDLQDMFVPMVDGFLVTLEEADACLDALLQQIPAMFADNRTTEVVLGPVVQAGIDALKSAERAGKLFIFHSTLPSLEAPGKLKNRDDRKLLGTEKEKNVLSPQTDFYTKLVPSCVDAGACVDLFLFPNAYIDVATLSAFATNTGGQVYKYQYFDAEKDGERFLFDLEHDIARPIAFDCMIRVRTSTGIRPTAFYGNVYMQNTTDMEVSAVDSDKAVTIEIKHDDKISEQAAYVQAALLYTSCSGQRRLRILNLCLAVAEQHAQLYRTADQDAVVNFIFKQAEHLQRDKAPKDVRDALTSRCAQILATYRERCSEQAPPGQLILPEGLKLLPLFVNCILKNDALAGAADLTVDDRSWMMDLVPALRVIESIRFLYPRVLPIHELPFDNIVQGDLSDLPTPVRSSYENLLPTGAYLIDNGVLMFVWLGGQLNEDFVRDLFGVNNIQQLDTEKHVLPEKDNVRSRALRRLISTTHRRNSRCMKMFLIRQGDKLEPWMRKFLVEDRSPTGSGASYVDYLCHIHKEIRQILS